MSTVTFQINDYSTGGSIPTVQVTITENADGTLTFNIVQLTSAGAYLGDLRGFFFDVNESLLNTLCVTSSAGYDAAGNCVTSMTDSQGLGTGNSTTGDNVTNLGDGSNMEGLLNADGTKTVKVAGAEANGYDVGIEIGTSGIGANDVRSFTFTLASDCRDLSLSDFLNCDFGIRITSIGQDINGDGIIDTSREASVKMAEDIGALANGIALSSSTVAENNAGAVVGTLSVAGPDGGTAAYTVSDSRFEVVAGALKLKDGASLNYETEQSVNVQVTASGSGWSADQTFTIGVTDVNEAPDAGDAQQATVAENVAAGVTLATVSASDPDVGGGNDADNNFEDLSYEITGGNAAGLFEIDAAGNVKLAAGKSLNFETANEHVLTVTVTDGGGLSDTALVTVSVSDVNEAPDAGDAQQPAVAENVAAGVTLATLSASDPDLGGDNDADNTFENLSYEITGGNAGGLFEIDAAGNVKLAASKSLDFETKNQHVLIVTVTDGGGLTDTAQVTINVADVNEQPNAGADQTVSVAENAAAGTPVATVAATDPDSGGGNDVDNNFENLSYSITAGNDDGFFAIDASTGAITTTGAIDFEAHQQFVLAVRATDGGTLYDEQQVTINITDVNEQPNAAANASFETAFVSAATDATDGWSVIGNVAQSTEQKTDGSFSAKLTSGGGSATATSVASFLGVASNAFTNFGDTPTSDGIGGSAIKTSTAVHLDAGDQLSFDWFFASAEPTSGGGFDNDFAFFLILTNTATNLSEIIDAAAGNRGVWNTETVTVAATGEYTSGFGVMDANNSGQTSTLYIDNLLIA